jgi:hypothetical protein
MKRRINFLTAYVFVSSIIFAFFIFSSFNEKDKNLKLDELTVKRLNLIGEDGSLRMVISNETRQHPGRVDGKDFPKRERPAGIIFFNNLGDECGGIIANVSSEKNSTNSGMSFTMDNFHDDQVIQILNDETYENGNAKIQRGLTIKEFPIGSSILSRNAKFEELEKIKDPKERDEKMHELWSKEGSKKRLFVGRNKNSDSGLFLYDTNGKPKMNIYVDKDGNPKIEVINENGEIRDIVDLK